jgi:DNA-binding HxlR family transcriptional regulator
MASNPKQERTIPLDTYQKESMKSDYEDESCKSCSTQQALSLIADKWTVLVIDALANGHQRYSEIHRSIGCITHKMLAQTLRRLERDGMLERKVYPVVPPKTEYTLTILGETLMAPIHAFYQWSEAHMQAVDQARITYDTAQERAIS